MTNSSIFVVFDNDRPAKYPHCKVDPSWDNNVFESWAEAMDYAENWLGQYAPPTGTLKPNEPYDYSGYGDTIKIVEISDERS